MDNHANRTTKQSTSPSTDPVALGENCAPTSAAIGSPGQPRFFKRQDRIGGYEVVGVAAADGARTGRDDMVVYWDLDSETLHYCSKPDFERNMVEAARLADLEPPTPLRVPRWEKRVRVDASKTTQEATISAMASEIAEYRRLVQRHCDPLRRYLSSYRVAPIDTTRVTRYGPNYWAAGADDEFGPRDEGEFVKLADIHTLVEHVMAVTPDSILAMLHGAAHQLESLGHVDEALELDRRIEAATGMARARPVESTASDIKQVKEQ
jgi:hypothetical protein